MKIKPGDVFWDNCVQSLYVVDDKTVWYDGYPENNWLISFDTIGTNVSNTSKEFICNLFEKPKKSK
jgi:hypothetical protein